MSDLLDQLRVDNEYHALLTEIFLAIDTNSVPLHLAVRLTPETLARIWAYMMRTWNIDVLMALRPLGLVQVAMTAAELVAERMDHKVDHWVERAQAVLTGAEPPRVLNDYIRTCAEWRISGSSEGQDRWDLLSRALMMARDVAEQRLAGNADPERQPVVANAFSVLWRARDLLPRAAFFAVRSELSELGPPTLEQIVAAAERGR